MKSVINRSTVLRNSRKGFALVATLLMLVLLMVLVLGMTSLSTVSLRTTGRDKAAQRAQANARLALQLAIGELQSLAGPDNRITASSSLRGDKTVQRHLTGVWEGWKWDGIGSAPDWEEEKASRFKGWLVSTNKVGSNLDEKFTDQASTGETVELINSTPDESGKVKAEIVRIAGNKSSNRDGLAWAVFDESQKASVSLSKQETEEKSYGTMFDQLTASHELGYRAVKSFDWKALSEKKGDRRKLLTIGQSRLLGLGKKDVSFHDITAGSYGLLTDVAKGGFASDLSQLFKDETLPSNFINRFLYSGEDKPLIPPPARFPGANPLPSPDPSWALLHSHYRTFTHLGGGTSPEWNVSLDSVAERPTSATADQSLRIEAFNKQQIAPVIAKAQFVFSLTFGYQAELEDMWKNDSARKAPASIKDNYLTFLVIDPVITLWNPYNVPLRFSDLTIELFRIPLAFQLYKNGNLISTNYTKLTDAYTKADFPERAKKPYLLKLLPETGKGSYVMQPGEHVVFSGHEWINHKSQATTDNGITLRPGFNPPAGAGSSPEIGGITSQNLFVNSSGESSGRDYGKKIRTVAVKGGDQIQIEVKPERAGADLLKETGGREVTGFVKYYVGVEGTDKERKLIGGIELDYGQKEKDLLPAYSRNELPTIIVNPAIPLGQRGPEPALRWKEPFLIATFQQKTERDSIFPSRSWINNAPANLYSSAGIDQTEDFAHQQYEFKWEPMTDWPPDSPTIEISNERNRGFGGSGVYAQTGTEFATFASLPKSPAHSLGQFSHAPLNAGGQLPLTARPFANSFAPPLISADKVVESAAGRTYLDHSYLANNALFDSYFLSTATNHPALSGSPSRDGKELLKSFFKDHKSLPNSRFKPYVKSEPVDDLLERMEDDKDAYRKIAANILVEAPFNVNSTSVAAWQAILASNFGGGIPLSNGDVSQEENLPVSRNLPSVGNSYESASGGVSADRAKWTGHRRLTEKQIQDLAEEIVDEVKSRGPFQSLAEFVNRQPGGGDKSKYGAVQAAIERAKINESVLDSGFNFSATTGANASAGSGNTADGAPAVITQSDILTPLLPQLTSRGDTFVVRAYGEAMGDNGEKSRVWCEATVQRYPEYVDPIDRAEDVPTSNVNKTFGRRFQVVSFRWLKPSEI